MDANSLQHELARPNLLLIPLETRLLVYTAILDDIQRDRHCWQRNMVSRYDGLLLTCRQLYHEATVHVFFGRITHSQQTKLLTLPKNRTTFRKLRSLHLEMDLVLEPTFFGAFVRVLNRFQLSLQELGLFFHGEDSAGNVLSAGGCGNHRFDIDNYHSVPTLPDPDKRHVAMKIQLMRQLANLRNLRVLCIENINVSLLPAAILSNKPHLEALSIRADPGSIVHGYRQFYRHIHALRGLLTPMSKMQCPPLRALELDMNGTEAAIHIVQRIAPTLVHLSWRLPGLAWQCRESMQEFSPYALTERLVQTLAWRAPNLRTLRLCIAMRDISPSSEQYQHDMRHVFTCLNMRIPRLIQLERFELHYSGADEFEFLRRRLITCMPNGLQRLYLSDTSIPPLSLCKQIYQRYLACNSNADTLIPQQKSTEFQLIPECHCDNGTKGICLNEINLTRFSGGQSISVAGAGFSPYTALTSTTTLIPRSLSTTQNASQGFRIGSIICGESRYRDDFIPLQSGKLGFVGYDFNAVDFDGEATSYDLPADFESERTAILRMNGRLLDREHNLHLLASCTKGYPGGILPQSNLYNELSGSAQDATETPVRSVHLDISVGLHEMANMAYSKGYIEARFRDLTECHELRDDPNEWYFGNEDQAQIVFDAEPVARIGSQTVKPCLVEVEARPSTRCRWLCPDAEVDPISTWPTPPLPYDWRDEPAISSN